MSLHPVFAQALKPWTPAPVAAQPAPSYKAPPLPRGMVEFEYSTPLLAEPLTCHLEYEPAERGSREYGTGLQLEPDYPANMTLCAAYLRGIDVFEILSSDMVEEIEVEALESGSDE
jgi:hypothetical protein